MPKPEDIAEQRWFAMPDDLTDSGWCLMNAQISPVAANPDFGQYQIARRLPQADAQQIAELHNAGLAGRPWTRPERYRVRAEDTPIFDELGATITAAEQLLQEAERTPAMQPLTEIRHLRAVLREVLAALSLLTEGAIRLRAQGAQIEH